MEVIDLSISSDEEELFVAQAADEDDYADMPELLTVGQKRGADEMGFSPRSAKRPASPSLEL